MGAQPVRDSELERSLEQFSGIIVSDMRANNGIGFCNIIKNSWALNFQYSAMDISEGVIRTTNNDFKARVRELIGDSGAFFTNIDMLRELKKENPESFGRFMGLSIAFFMVSSPENDDAVSLANYFSALDHAIGLQSLESELKNLISTTSRER